MLFFFFNKGWHRLLSVFSLQVLSRRPSGRSLPAALPTSLTRLCVTVSAWRSSTGSQRRWKPSSSTGSRDDRCPRLPNSKWPGWTRTNKFWASERPMRDCSPWPPLNSLSSKWIIISFGTFVSSRISVIPRRKDSMPCSTCVFVSLSKCPLRSNVVHKINVLLNTYCSFVFLL